LAAAISIRVSNNPDISNAAKTQVGVRLEAGVQFVSASQVEQGLKNAHVRPSQVDALTASYKQAQLDGLKAALLAAAGIALGGLLFTSNLPSGSGLPAPPSPEMAADSSFSGDAPVPAGRRIEGAGAG